MNRSSGVILLVVGCAVMLGGAAMALREFAGLYRGVLADPLAPPEGTEQGVSRRMLTGAAVGAIGVPLAIAGSIALKRRRKVHAARHARGS